MTTNIEFLVLCVTEVLSLVLEVEGMVNMDLLSVMGYNVTRASKT